MLRDLITVLAVFFIIGLSAYLMRFPIERGLTMRGERQANRMSVTPPKVHRKSQPFKSYRSPIPERKCQFKIKSGKGFKVCNKPESEHGLLIGKHTVTDHLFTR